MPEAAHPPGRLVHLPLPLFALPMGLGGLGLAWREAARSLGAPALVGEALLALTVLAWTGVAALHGLRLLRHPEALLADLRHPVRGAFAGAITIGLILVAAACLPYLPGLAAGIWLLAVAGHIGIGVWLMRLLLHAPREPALYAPPLIIPLVGNVLAPLVGVRLGFETLSWMLFGIGVLLWLFLQPLLLGRLASGPALPPRLRPTVVIFLAPPAVASLAAAALTKGFGPLPLGLFGLALFLVLVLLTFLPEFARAPFAMSWWGWTFPTAAFSASVIGVMQAHPVPGLSWLPWLALLAATAILAIVATATWQAHARGELLAPE